MRGLVVRQPWATLIALGVKRIETRPWPPNGPMRPDGVRGLPGCTLERGERIAIVAGAQMGLPSLSKLGDAAQVFRRLDGDWDLGHAPICDPSTGRFRGVSPLPLGAVVCTVTVDDALPVVDETGGHMDELYQTVDGRDLARQTLTGDGSRPEHVLTTWLTDQLPLGDFSPGRWGWLLSHPQPCDPVPCKGRQGVFTLPEPVAEALS